MTDPYAETDDWPIAPATRPHGDAQPVSAPEPSGSTPEAGEGARLARYAEAMGTPMPQPTGKKIRRIEAVMAVADEETAELRAEVEQLRRGGAELGRILDRSLRDVLDASGRHDAIQEDGDGDWAVVWETLAGLRPRAEAAEAESARLASVVELHKKALNVALNLVGIHPDLHTKDDREALEGCRMVLDDEPAALASVAPDTATPGERRMTYVDAKTHEPCPTSGPVLCTIGYTDPAHRHVAAHMVAYSSADDNLGGES